LSGVEFPFILTPDLASTAACLTEVARASGFLDFAAPAFTGLFGALETTALPKFFFTPGNFEDFGFAEAALAERPFACFAVLDAIFAEADGPAEAAALMLRLTVTVPVRALPTAFTRDLPDAAAEEEAARTAAFFTFCLCFADARRPELGGEPFMMRPSLMLSPQALPWARTIQRSSKLTRSYSPAGCSQAIAGRSGKCRATDDYCKSWAAQGMTNRGLHVAVKYNFTVH